MAGVVLIAAAGCQSNGPVIRPANGGAVDNGVESVARVPTESLVNGEAAIPDGDAPPAEAELVDVEQAVDTEPAYNRVDRTGVFPEYRIGPSDVLRFDSLEPDIPGATLNVRFDGYISLPWVEDVKVSGLTRDEATTAVVEAYSEFIEDPQLNVVILQANSKSYMVMGDVRQPGEYAYNRPTTVLGAINAAGGLRLYQQPGGERFVGLQGQLIKALVIRPRVDGGREVIEYDLRDAMEPGQHPADDPVFPGDIVYVPESVNLVYVLGEAGAGVYALTQGMGILELLATSGGFSTTRSRINHVVLIREVDAANSEIFIVNVKRILKTGQDVPLEPGDVIYVPRKLLVQAQEFVAQLTGTLYPIANLYQRAYDVYYTEERYDRLFNDDEFNNTNNVLNTLQSVQDVSDFFGTLPLTVPAP
jgi:protein involved in polysaccharide export with SLBB domain